MSEIKIYKSNTGKEPFREWMTTLDRNTVARIDARLARIRQNGNLGDCKHIGDGVYELKFAFGPGYRIYFGYELDALILLFGGDKKSQLKDIAHAKQYWHDHKKR